MPEMHSPFTLLSSKFPDAAAAFRELRDTWRFLKSRAAISAFGCRLAGNDGMVTGDYERDELDLLGELLETADVLVDIGANIGLFSCLARSRGKRVIAIEAMPSNLRYLLRNLEENGFGDVEVIPVAVSASPGIAKMYASGVGASLLAGWAGSDESFSTRVTVTTLDSLLAHRLSGLRTVVKMDIEGAEEAALRGATNLLRNSPAPSWIVENNFDEHFPGGKNPDFRRVFSHFWENGYEAFTATKSRDAVTEQDVDSWLAGRGRPSARNFLFQKPG
jgi:FkbM family methyltransferase